MMLWAFETERKIYHRTFMYIIHKSSVITQVNK